MASMKGKYAMKQEAIKRAAALLRSADGLLITAGAGMGVDSGLPDFRGDQGFWQAYPALRGYSFIDMANPRWFHTDPQRAWGFYGHRLNLYRSTIPHRGFSLLKQWSADKREGSFVFTSNVDGQFQEAGFNPLEVCECHGSIHHLQGFVRSAEIVSAEGIALEIDEEALRLVGDLPTHPKIKGDLRPNILMFGDISWNGRRTYEQEARLERWLERWERVGSEAKLVIIEMGAGTAIPSVRGMGENAVYRCPQASLIRINPRESQLDEVSPDRGVSLPMGALEALTLIDEVYQTLR